MRLDTDEITQRRLCESSNTEDECCDGLKGADDEYWNCG